LAVDCLHRDDCSAHLASIPKVGDAILAADSSSKEVSHRSDDSIWGARGARYSWGCATDCSRPTRYYEQPSRVRPNPSPSYSIPTAAGR